MLFTARFIYLSTYLLTISIHSMYGMLHTVLFEMVSCFLVFFSIYVFIYFPYGGSCWLYIMVQTVETFIHQNICIPLRIEACSTGLLSIFMG